MISNNDLAYMAGIVDGEGSIGVTYHKPRNAYRLQLTVTNTNEEIMNWIVYRFDGNYYTHTIHPSYCKPRFDWVTVGKYAQHVISQIYPYLIIKRKRAEIALTMIVGESGGKADPDLRGNQEIVYDMLKILNERGSHI